MSVEGFWRNLNIDTHRPFLGVDNQITNVYYLFPQGGGPIGHSGKTFSTFAGLAPKLKSRDTIILCGVLREQASAPRGVHDVTIIGGANRVRQATDGGVPTGGGASWLPPAVPAAGTALLSLPFNIGWQFENIEFNPPAAVNSPGVLLERSASTEAGQARFKNCLFLGGGANQVGIDDQGGNGFVEIEECEFHYLAFAIRLRAIVTGIPGWWLIKKNRFSHNTNDITMSLHASIIQGNVFQTAGAGGVNKVVSTKSQGDGGAGSSENYVIENFFNNLQANIQESNGYSGCATDIWRNYSTDTAAQTVGVPGA